MGLASSGCEESHWISDSSMLCKIFPGVGGNLAVMTQEQLSCANVTAFVRSYAQQVGINPGWTPHVQKVPQKAVAKAKSHYLRGVACSSGCLHDMCDVVNDLNFVTEGCDFFHFTRKTLSRHYTTT